MVPDFAQTAKLANQKIPKRKPQRCTELATDEKNVLNDSNQMTLYTCACGHQSGFEMMQEILDGPISLLPYWSQSLTASKNIAAQTMRKALPSFRRSYLNGTGFNIRTDHDLYRWRLNLTGGTGRLSRWRLRMSELKFDVIYQTKIKHQAADGLSGLKTTRTDNSALEKEVPEKNVTMSIRKICMRTETIMIRIRHPPLTNTGTTKRHSQRLKRVNVLRAKQLKQGSRTED